MKFINRLSRRFRMNQEVETLKINGVQVECGKRGTPTMKILVKLAEVYGVPVSALSNKVEAELAFEKEKAKKTKEKHEPEEKEDMPNLELDFLYRGYENLSEEKKRSLKDFFFYLQKGEKEYEER